MSTALSGRAGFSICELPKKGITSGAMHPATYNLLFVCTGNTCRSPMAEAVARREIEVRGWKHVRVSSAGVSARAGAQASPGALAAVTARGLDLSGHRSRLVDPEALAWADVVLAMSPSHLSVLESLGAGGKSALLGEFAGRGGGVPDPFGGDLETYRATLDDLSELVRRSLDRIAPVVSP